jgi:hypothetical protein
MVGYRSRVAARIVRGLTWALVCTCFAACSGHVTFHNPKASPYGHSQDGVVSVKAGPHVCWNLGAFDDRAGYKHIHGCGSRTVSLHRYGAFDVSITKIDHTSEPLEAVLSSDGRVLMRRSTKTYLGDLLLVG